MKLENIPSGGCFYATGTNTFAHQLGNSRTVYYLPYDSSRLVRGSTSTSTSTPTGVYCLNDDDIIIKSEVTDVYFPLIAIAVLVGIFLWWVNLMLRGWLK